MKNNIQLQSGFTFLEVLMASFISVILVFGAASMWYYFINSYQFSFELSQALSLASDNVHMMTTEARESQNGEEGSYPLTTADDQEFVFQSDIDNDGEVEKVRYYLVGTQLIKQVFNITPGTTSYACVDGCTICHNGNTLNVDEHAWPAHQNHSDSLGACGQGGQGSGQTGGETSERVVADFVRNGSEPVFTYYNGDWPGDTTNNPLPDGERLLNTRMVKVKLIVQVSEGPVGPEATEIENSVHLRNLKDNL